MPPGAHRWLTAAATNVGRVRASNQDAYAVVDDLGWWIVADGMGGHPGGDVASRVAVETIVTLVRRHAPHPGQDADGEQLVADMIREANAAVRREAQRDRHLAGMGTTIVVVRIIPDAPPRAIIGHVGDSRAYLVRRGDLVRLTRDHSLVEASLQRGLLTPAEAERHPLRHVLAQAVGPELIVKPDVTTARLESGDRLLLCTDGLTKMLTETTLQQLLVQPLPLTQVPTRLIETANRAGGEDNTTVVVIDWLEASQAPASEV